MSAYTLVDRASWHSFSNKHDFQIIMEGDKRLFNPYGIMLISKEKCPSVKSKEGQLFIDWLISDKGQKIIGQFTINERRVFNPHSD
jgi:tungstate transport system substrate-binding protein